MNTINVNLKPCDCWPNGVPTRGNHFPICSATPMLIPCPIPRTVEMMVRLGECDCLADDHLSHRRDCAERPIRVTCTIGGATWAGSKPLTFTMPDGSEAPMVIADACRAAWEIVVALVTGKSVTTKYGPEHPILKQRDAVFAALADMVRLDTQRDAALARAAMALGGGVFVHSCPRAEEVLGQYVSHLITVVHTGFVL